MNDEIEGVTRSDPRPGLRPIRSKSRACSRLLNPPASSRSVVQFFKNQLQNSGLSLMNVQDTKTPKNADPKVFGKFVIPSLGIILVLITTATLASFAFILSSDQKNEWNQILSIHLVQISAGLLLGTLCLFLGTSMCWFGVSGIYSIGAESGGSKLNIQSAQVGILLLAGGLLLTVFSLHKSITTSELTKYSQVSPNLKSEPNSANISESKDAKSQEYKILLEKLETLATASANPTSVDQVAGKETKLQAQEIQAAQLVGARKSLEIVQDVIKSDTGQNQTRVIVEIEQKLSNYVKDLSKSSGSRK